MTHYELIIIGAGSAGLPTGMYASRYNIKNLIIGSFPGWALATSHKVENYPWVLSAWGKEIMDTFKKHAETAGSEFLQDTVTYVEKIESGFLLKTWSGKEFTSNYVVLATGNEYRKLWVPWEAEFLGKWVSYCATCDGTFFKGMDVAIAWGGNTALTEALYLSEICKSVTIIHRRDTFRAENIWVEQAKKRDNIIFVMNEEIQEIKGGLFVEEILLKSGRSVKADGIFIAVGTIPFTKIVDNLNPLKDEEGCLVVDKRQETNITWLYAAGDVTTNSNKFRQTIMSAAEWCLAANSIHEDILHTR
jgi:thioredoxin reductase (NADPH)